MRNILCLVLFVTLSRHGLSQSLYNRILDADSNYFAPRIYKNRDSNINFNREQLRDYTYCKCIYHYVNDTAKFRLVDESPRLETDLRLTSDSSFAFLQNISNYKPEAYEAIDSFVLQFLNGQRWRKVDDGKRSRVKGAVWDCVCLYNSKHLKNFIEMQDKYFLGTAKSGKIKK